MKKKVYKKGLHYWGPKLWGSIPKEIQTEESASRFKNYVNINSKILCDTFFLFDNI